MPPVSAAPGVLLGVQTIGTVVDSNPAGTAEAFQYTATASGTANRIHLYVDSTSTTTQVRVGLYSNAVGDVPGTLLPRLINNPIPGAGIQSLFLPPP
jgi:hypothetical protein